LGAEVHVTTSPAGRLLVESLGADRVIDYTREAIEDASGNVDGVFDLVGGDTLMKSFQVVKAAGTIVSIAGIPEPTTARKDLGRGWGLAALFWVLSYRLRAVARKHRVRYRYYFMCGSGSDLDEIARLIDGQKLRVIVDRKFAFAQIAEAFSLLEQGHAKGKIIVTME